MGAASFPSPDERRAATALLLLAPRPTAPSSVAPPLLSATVSAFHSLSCSDKISCIHGGAEELSYCISDSSSSMVTRICGSQIRADPLQMLALAAFLNGIKSMDLAVKKARSRTMPMRRIMKVEQEEWSEGTVVSSLTSASSSSAGTDQLLVKKQARGPRNKGRVVRRWWWRRPTLSVTPAVRRRAEAIKEYLLGGSASEVRIRGALGDSPDTSKALRMLLKMDEVRRTGAGGRRDPFLYTVAGRQSEIS